MRRQRGRRVIFKKRPGVGTRRTKNKTPTLKGTPPPKQPDFFTQCVVPAVPPPPKKKTNARSYDTKVQILCSDESHRPVQNKSAAKFHNDSLFFSLVSISTGRQFWGVARQLDDAQTGVGQFAENGFLRQVDVIRGKKGSLIESSDKNCHHTIEIFLQH